MPTTLKTTWRWFLLVVLLIAAADAALMIMHHRAAMTAELAKTGAKEQDVYWAALGSRMQDALSALEAAAVEAAEDASIRRLVVQGRRAVDEEGGGEGGEESAKIRSDLLKELVDRWGIFTRYYPVDHVHVYLPPDQTVFLRVPNSSNFGDALGDRARVVAKAAAQGVPVNGFEAGPAYAGLRAAAPIMAQSSDSNESFMAGVVEVGVGMGPLLEKLKNDMGVDAAPAVVRNRARRNSLIRPHRGRAQRRTLGRRILPGFIHRPHPGQIVGPGPGQGRGPAGRSVGIHDVGALFDHCPPER